MDTSENRKIEYWKSQLLDLGKRNKMVNYRETSRATLKIVSPDFNALYKNIVSDEKELVFQYPVDKDSDIRTYSVMQLLNALHYPVEVCLGDIKTESSIADMNRTLKNLRNKSKLALEEQGINILYLSFGFIEWRENSRPSAKWIKSPLILVPIRLVLDSFNTPFKLSRYDDDIAVNPTLKYLFNSEYGISLPEFDGDIDNLDKFFLDIENIATEKGWRVLKECSIGLLSFLKINMYEDLQNNLERMLENPIIKAMTGDSSSLPEIPEDIINYNHDLIQPKDSYQILSADSSQQDAILFSKNGISFVMQGPPGTGKSQTIANIIAEAIADGKKVLFVSEKMAALQVVYNRLSELGLGSFCLSLHSHRANKKDILEDLQRTLSQKHKRVKNEAIEELERLNIERTLLNEYSSDLHEIIQPLDISCYQAIGTLDSLQDVTDYNFAIPDIESVSRVQLNERLYGLESYSDTINEQGFDYKNNPWSDTVLTSVSYDTKHQINIRIKSFTNALKNIIEITDNIKENYHGGNLSTVSGVKEYIGTVSGMADMPIIPDYLVDMDDAAGFLERTQNIKEKFEALQHHGNDVEVYFNEMVWGCNLISLKSDIEKAIDERRTLNVKNAGDTEYFLVNSDNIVLNLNDCRAKVKKILDIFYDTNKSLGLNLDATLSNIKLLRDILNKLSEKTIVQEQWFDLHTVETAIENVVKYKTLTERIINQRNIILEIWEDSILSFDYKDILQRYKTEYTNIFKIFKGSYRNDKKIIRQFNKNPLNKITDKEIVDVLLSLQTLDNLQNELSQERTTIDRLYGSMFKDEYTDWDSISSSIRYIREFIELCPGIQNYKEIKSILLDKACDINISEVLYETDESKVKTAIDQFNNWFSVDNLEDFSLGSASERLLKFISEMDKLILLKQELETVLREPVSFESILNKISDAISVQDEKKALLSNGEQYLSIYRDFYKGEQTDWASVVLMLQRVNSAINTVKANGLPKDLVFCMATDSSYKDKLLKVVDEASAIVDDISEDWIWFSGLFKEKTDDKELRSILSKSTACGEKRDQLEPTIKYNNAKDKCIALGMEDYISFIEEKEVSNIVSAYKKRFYSLWLGKLMDKKKSIGLFDRQVQEKRISDFSEMDSHQLKIAQMRIRERLTMSLPKTDRFLHAQDEMSILQRELGKKTRIMPLRKLFKSIPNLLLKIKPCFMMSPLSVSYFLEAETYKFDMVIFDEASQVFPEDAIGAIFRGKQVIVAGDSKQMPPTNFFAANTNNQDGYDDDDEEDEPIYDSILEETASILPNRTLLWHYRSKHENLISFSNQKIYNNSLITFPSSQDKKADMGVEYYKVNDGVYEDRCNKKEAEFCVDLVKEHIEKYPDRTLGIIAFSEKQQSTIEQAIYEFRENNPVYEDFFKEDKEESFFVKNLENVQGDERDTIIFSICYAKNANGYMRMNFGPLGKAGGERRLNVAVTRAKLNIKLVGSVSPEDIDLSRAKSEGARMLRSYIEFAIKGTLPKEKDIGIKDDYDADQLCDNISSLLEKKGYNVVRNVGRSEYKIDIAIEHPTQKGVYIAGIECDGETYAGSRTARDRECLKENILNSMGWNMYRIWSVAWIKSPAAEEKKLLDFIERAAKEYGKIKNNKKIINYDVPLEVDIIFNQEDNISGLNNSYGFGYYEVADWVDAPQDYSSGDIQRISDVLEYIIGIEQPIHMDLLYQRIAGLFGRSKATSVVRDNVDYVINQHMTSIVNIVDNFASLNSMEHIRVRVSEIITEEIRKIEHISMPEIKQAMITIAAYAVGMSENDLKVETARIFGFERMGPKVANAMNTAVAEMIESKQIEIMDEKVHVLEDINNG